MSASTQPAEAVELRKQVFLPEAGSTDPMEYSVSDTLFWTDKLKRATELAKKLKEQRDTARREAEVDALTGAANRRALDRALPAAEADENTSIIAFDANDFGLINKRFGEAEGDKVLKEMSDALDAAVQENGGRLFRKGGDEFTILAPKKAAEKIRDRAEALFGEKDHKDFKVSVSGVVGSTFAEADAELQKRKAERKGTKKVEGFVRGEKAASSSGYGEGYNVFDNGSQQWI
jgi:diguanylate cyclase (GGDEF)-like protein